MDEVRLNNSFSKRVLSEIITNKLRKKFGDNLGIRVNDLSIDTAISEDRKKVYTFNIDVDGTIAQEVLEELWEKRNGSGTS